MLFGYDLMEICGGIFFNKTFVFCGSAGLELFVGLRCFRRVL